jgi:uncharacterized protein
MPTRPPDPRRLGVEAFAREGGVLEGSEPLPAFPRLLASAHSERPPGAAEQVVWRARGELRKPLAVEPQIWMQLQARTRLALVCQRCLGPIDTAIEVDRWFRFARSEAEAEALDAEIEEDVLALERALDLHELIEDELLLAMPLVPRHAACPLPLPLPESDVPTAEAPAHPFAALASLRDRMRGDG